MINYSYLEPPARVSRTKLSQDDIFIKLNNKPLRKIFQNVLYESFEEQAIKELKDYLSKKQPNILYTDALLLRLIYLGEFVFSKSVEAVARYGDWHHNESITHTTKVAQSILEDGIIYSFGRDYQFAPNIYVMVGKIDLKKHEYDDYLNAICSLCRPLEEHMLVGGVVEKWNIMVDCMNRKCPIDAPTIKKCLDTLKYAYAFRLKRIVILNWHTSYGELINWTEGLESTLVKQVSQLGRWVAVQERQRRYGGTVGDLCQYWPIHSTNKYEEEQTLLKNEESQSEEEYKTVLNDNQYFEGAKQVYCDVNCSIY